MLTVFDDIPSSESLLMQCGYRSKSCTNIRTAKIDGTLHRLCEFHRCKANESQQRLHQRQREQRFKRLRAEAAMEHPAKTVQLMVQVPIDTTFIDPIPYNRFDSGTKEIYPYECMTPFEMLELLLLDSKPLKPRDSSPIAVDDPRQSNSGIDAHNMSAYYALYPEPEQERSPRKLSICWAAL